MMTRRLAILLIVTVWGLILIVWGLLIIILATPPVAPFEEQQLPMLEPCPTEDSVNCYWDAELQGNGAGDSFTVDPDGTTHHWEE
jgi:hypothetical protein